MSTRRERPAEQPDKLTQELEKLRRQTGSTPHGERPPVQQPAE